MFAVRPACLDYREDRVQIELCKSTTVLKKSDRWWPCSNSISTDQMFEADSGVDSVPRGCYTVLRLVSDYHGERKVAV
jgi:hypothetical protein